MGFSSCGTWTWLLSGIQNLLKPGTEPMYPSGRQIPYPLDHQGSPNFILLQVDYPAIAAPFLKKIILSPLNGLGTLVKNQLTVDMWVNFWTQFYSIDLIIYPYTNTTLS